MFDCTFANNSADEGGAVVLRGQGQARFERTLFSNNSAVGGSGGAVVARLIPIWGGVPTAFTRCTFENNTASASGGAVALLSEPNKKMESAFTACTFKQNRALGIAASSTTGGGAVFIKPTIEDVVTFLNSIFEGNVAIRDEPGAPSGGALMVKRQLKTLSIVSCVFNYNSAVNQHPSGLAFGGAVFLNAPAELQNCHFTSNMAAAALDSTGGALYHAAGANKALKLLTSTFQRNKAFTGGGIALQQMAALQVVEGCRFENNTALDTHHVGAVKMGSGGGSAVISPCTALFRNCNWVGNTARQGGAMGISGVQAAPLLDSCTLQGNIADGIDAGGGALAVFRGAHLSLLGSSLSTNVGDYGGALVVTGATMSWNRTVCVANIARQGGGCLMLAAGAYSEMRDSNVSHNRALGATLAGGGAIYSQTPGVSHYLTTTFLNNSASLGYGGAMMLFAPAEAHFAACRFELNLARYEGGAVWYSGAGTWNTFSHCFFQNNILLQNSGGGAGLAIRLGSLVRVSQSVLRNHAGVPGSAVFINDASPLFVSTNFQQNKGVAGAVYTKGTSSPSFSECSWQQNHGIGGTESIPALGAALHLNDNGNPRVEGCSFLENTMEAPGMGAGVWVGLRTGAVMLKSTFGSNEADYGGAAVVTNIAATPFIGCFFNNNHARALGGGQSMSLKMLPSTCSSITFTTIVLLMQGVVFPWTIILLGRSNTTSSSGTEQVTSVLGSPSQCGRSLQSLC